MITNLFIDFFLYVLSAFRYALPDFTEQIVWLQGLAPQASGLGAYLGLLDAVLPLTVLFSVMGYMMPGMVLLALYRVINWVWRHIPIIAGFGPGSG